MAQEQQDRSPDQQEDRSDEPRQSQNGRQSLRPQRDRDTAQETRTPAAGERNTAGLGSSVGQERETGRQDGKADGRSHPSDDARETPSSADSMVNNLTGAYSKRP